MSRVALYKECSEYSWDAHMKTMHGFQLKLDLLISSLHTHFGVPLVSRIQFSQYSEQRFCLQMASGWTEVDPT